MLAVTTQAFGGSEQLLLKEVPLPKAGESEVLIQVFAAGVNRADCLMRAGQYLDYHLDQLLGLEVAGQIVACGASVKKWQVGDRVCALLSQGGYAEYCLANEQLVLPLPAEWSYEAGAAFIENYLTAYATIWELAQFKKGETLLIHAIASGVGLAACQLAFLEGGIVYGTTRSLSKITPLSQFFPALNILHPKEGNFVAQLSSEVKTPIDVILDSVGGGYLPQNLKVLTNKGRLIQIAMMAGAKSEINLASLVLKRLKIYGFVLRSQSLTEKQKLLASFYQKWKNALENGKIEPIIDSVLPFSEVKRAHDRMEANAHLGKIILKWDSE